ncbi:MAG: hypothetical protein P8O93_05165 [Flavobacteriaceae bacterium]|mgnify:CR=1 FL=1|nr:hypothetical protein [Flavobacteriaceae bacterium]MDG1962956.1 hypothetical protein [Flavobacteriaceae bacterium]
MVLNKFFLAVMTVFALNAQQLIAQDCNPEVSVLHNRNRRSITNTNGTNFTLVVSNNTILEQTYTLSAVPNSADCYDGRGGATSQRNANNISLLFSVEGLRLSQVVVAPRSELTVMVSVEASNRLTINDWTCFLIKATGVTCRAVDDGQLIMVYSGSDDEG